jgi:hypothetical protein
MPQICTTYVKSSLMKICLLFLMFQAIVQFSKTDHRNWQHVIWVWIVKLCLFPDSGINTCKETSNYYTTNGDS